MKIAYVCQTYPPEISGPSRFARNLAKGMVQRGHSVLVVASSDKGQNYAEQSGNLRVMRLRSLPNPFRSAQHFMLWPLRGVQHEFERFGPEVVHIHDALVVGVAGAIAGRRVGARVVLTTHALPEFVSALAPNFAPLRRGIEVALWWFGKWFMHRCDAVVSPTHAVAHTIRQRTNIRPRVVSNGIDLSWFRPAQSQAGKQGSAPSPERSRASPTLLHVGQLHAAKRVDVLLRAVARAMAHRDARLLVVGDGPARERLEALAKDLGIADRTMFLGFVPLDAELPDIYRSASMFVSASDVETQGLVLLEAAASGLPIIAVQADSVSEIVQDGLNGFLVPVADVDAMAERIVCLLQDPQRRNSMGRVSRGLAEAHTLETTLDTYEDIYTKLASD